MPTTTALVRSAEEASMCFRAAALCSGLGGLAVGARLLGSTSMAFETFLVLTGFYFLQGVCVWLAGWKQRCQPVLARPHERRPSSDQQSDDSAHASAA